MNKRKKANLISLLAYVLCMLVLASFVMAKAGFLSTL